MNVKKILVAVIAGLVIGAAAVLCFRGCGADVCGDGERTDEVRTELNGAIRNQQQSISDLDSAADTAVGVREELESGREGVQAAAESNLQLKEGNDRAGELIRECQSILRTVRERGASQTE